MDNLKHISQIIPVKVEQVKDLAPQTQELKGLVTGDEKKFAIALQSKLIKKSSMDEVKNVLKYVMIKVGLRAQNFPNEIETLVLYEHIASNYGGHTLEEIKVAFDMAITNKLDLKEGESAICYENFSCLYFSSIMNAFERWAEGVYKESFEAKMQKPEQKIFTQDELDDYARESCEWQYQLFLRGNPIADIESNLDILKKDGLIKDDETVAEMFLRRMGKEVFNIYKKQ